MIKKIYYPFFLIFSVVLLSIPAFTGGARLLREPTISKDYVAFVYANDIWVVSRSGGSAHRVTTHIGTESNPMFSPDGSYIAFSGQYDGNTDVYVVPTEGG